MFRSARIKLTAWYLAIIMIVSIFFSLIIYRVLTFELDRVERMQRLRSEINLCQPDYPPFNLRQDIGRTFILDPDIINETKNRLKIILLIINSGILGTSALAGYFLAGRTLRPIAEMLDDQSRFITDASHELRTPITSLKSEIEVNLRNKKLTLIDARRVLESNLEETNSLQNLSDRLIKLIKYQKKGNGLNITNIALAEIISEAIKKVSGLARANNITIINETTNYNLEGDKQALTEMLVIFLDNTIKYSHPSSKVNISSSSNDRNIIFKIADRGIGIEQKDIPYLFERFYRTDKSRTKSDVSGYGLGLSIAKQIIDRHQGTIDVKSCLNKGTTFTVQIPAKHSRLFI
ncbi:MAG: HAMP domain-containing sensor histidine kinase [Candidatus Gottesmanbacteria bacterium]